MKLTVFTPTYNRAATLPRVFASLQAQTLAKDAFEWLIIDDGSSDETAALVESWRAQAGFSLRYAWQPNGGKHRAWNRAVAQARGELFTFIDSDDACLPDALERIMTRWEVARGHRSDLAGVLARCVDGDGQAIGPPFPALEAASFAELWFRHRLRHETWATVTTEILKQHPFPDGPRGLLVPEGALWHRLSRHHRFLLEPTALRIYYTGRHGRLDQLSHPEPLGKQAPGMSIALQAVLDHSWAHFADAPIEFVRTAIHFGRFSLHEGACLAGRIAALERPAARALVRAALPMAGVLYLRDRFQGRA